MKTTNRFKIMIGLMIFSIINISGSLLAQATHNVAVSDFKFESANLTIAKGDIVKWTNNEGTHSINGTTSSFPNNPASFSNSSGGPGWTFSFTFSTEGVYDYKCGVHGSMTGKITVGNATGIEDNSSSTIQLSAFPNPSNGILNIPVPERWYLENTAKTLKIYNLSGAMLSQQDYSSEKTIQTDIKELAKGIYFYKLLSETQVITSGKFMKLD